jgi:hypothetical protein
VPIVHPPSPYPNFELFIPLNSNVPYDCLDNNLVIVYDIHLTSSMLQALVPDHDLCYINGLVIMDVCHLDHLGFEASVPVIIWFGRNESAFDQAVLFIFVID